MAGLRGEREGEQRGCSGGSGSNTFLVQKVVGCFVHREFRTIRKLAEIGILVSPCADDSKQHRKKYI